MPELTTREHLESVVDQIALGLAHDTDDQVRPLLPMMRMNLHDTLSKHDLGMNAGELTELLIGNIFATRQEIRLRAGQMSRALH